jgi:hypothetical protein
MKTHTVREAFTLGGEHYPRGAEINDPAILKMAKENHSSHLICTPHDAPAPDAKEKAKAK